MFFKFFKRKKQQPKLGVAFGSGGAKGYALVGALKAFEEANLNFDYVAGSSIGSIVGAFYAEGYNHQDMLNLLGSLDFSNLKNLFLLGMDSVNVVKMLDDVIGGLNVEELKKPFKAIATDKTSGEEVVLSKGSVAKALAASSSYPPFFRPVEIDGRVLIDGAFSNSIPADVVKNMGADIVVGIDLAAFREAEKQNFALKFIPQVKVGKENPAEAGYQNADVMLRPMLGEYTPLSINDGDQMFEIGYTTAKSMIDEINNKIENFGKKRKKR